MAPAQQGPGYLRTGCTDVCGAAQASARSRLRRLSWHALYLHHPHMNMTRVRVRAEGRRAA